MEFDLEALGDFPPSADTHEVLGEAAPSGPLAIPAGTRAVTIEATDGFSRLLGASALGPSGDVDVALWPGAEACTLVDPHADGYPGSSTAQAAGVAPALGLLLVAGGEGGGSPVATGALTIDLTTGTVAHMASSEGPHVRRAGGTVTPFGSDLLVAGGHDPVENQAAVASAEVFDTATRSFDPAILRLEQPRAGHAAVTLATGETLLIGGEDDSRRPLATLVAISPESRQYRISGLADLRAPRVDPVAIRLSDDRVLVASGAESSAPDALPTDTLEWLTVDASRNVREAAFSEAATHVVGSGAHGKVAGRALVAMPGGSALAVGGCLRDAATASCLPSPDVYWITKGGRIDLLPDALGVDASRAELVPGEEGRPWLFATAGDGSRALRRFDPWLGRFVATGAPTPPADPAARFFAPDPGLVLWLAAGDPGSAKAVSGFRHGTRGPYSQSVAPLLLVDTTGVALDRAVGAGEASPTGDASRAPGTGDVVLAAPDATLVLTDTTYADLSLTADVRQGAPPIVLLGAAELGGKECPWPVSAPTAPYEASLARVADRVLLTVAGKTRDCRGPSGRVSVAFRPGDDGELQLHQVTVTRGGS